jgi:hypothetical protein
LGAEESQRKIFFPFPQKSKHCITAVKRILIIVGRSGGTQFENSLAFAREYSKRHQRNMGILSGSDVNANQFVRECLLPWPNLSVMYSVCSADIFC